MLRNAKMEKTVMLPALAAAVLAIYAGAVFLAYKIGEMTLLNLMLGAAIAMANTVLTYYFGSSRGSQAKDETIAAAAARGNGGASDQPVAIAVANPGPDAAVAESAPTPHVP